MPALGHFPGNDYPLIHLHSAPPPEDPVAYSE